MKLKNVVKILGLAFVAVFSGASALSSVKETKSADAANIPGSTVLYLTPNTNWNVGNARFAAYFFGNGDAWASMTKVAGETNLYSVITPGTSWTNVIFCRMNPSAAANNWDNKWNQTADLTWDGTNNHYTVKENTWDKGGGTWSTYTPAVALEEYVVTYHNKEGAVAETETVVEGATFEPKLLKEDGLRLEGWYLESTFTNKISKGDLITSDIDVYPNYVEANDYWIYIYDENAVLGNNVKVHIFGDELGAPAPAAWPGEAAENLKHGFWRFKVEADQGYDAIVVNNGDTDSMKQTVNLSLSHESEIFYIGALSEGKYTAMTLDVTAANLAVYIMAGSEDGQCNVQFAPARDFYLSMSASEQELFQTSDDEAIAAARARYEAWATALGQKAYEAGSLSRGSLLTASNSNSLILVAIIASVIGVGALFAIKALKHKKEN